MKIVTVPINTIAPSWLPRAQSVASTVFQTLFTFEIFLLGLYALLHGQSIAHLFSSFAFKTFLLTFFMYLMTNSPTILPSIINSFKIAGQSTGLTGTTNLMDMYHQADSSAELFFCAAMASHIEDQESALEFGFFDGPPEEPPGNGDYAHTFQGAIGHITFEFIVQGLGMLVIAGTGIMFLSLALITSEAYITMFAGVFFLGFSLSRYTLPFTQGYLAYTLNVGVKMLTYWVLIAIETAALLPVLNRAGVGLINAATIQFGANAQPFQTRDLSQELYLIYAGVDVSQILAMGALTWFIPNAMGRFVTDRSSASAMNLITNMGSTIKRTLAGGGSVAGPMTPAPGPVSPAGSSFVIPPNATMRPIVNVVVAARSPMRTDPLRSQAPPFVAPPPETFAAPAATVETSLIEETLLPDIDEQAVQASVSDGDDPFAVKPKIEPILVHLDPRKRPGSDRTATGPTEDDIARQNAVANAVEPTPSTNPNVPDAILQQNAGANVPFAAANAQSFPRNARAASGASLIKAPLRKAAGELPATLTLLSPEEIKLLPPDKFVLLLEATRWNTLSVEQRGAIEQDERLRALAEKIIPQRPHAPEMSNTASEPPATLTLLSPEEIKLLPPDEFVLLLEATQWNALSAEQRGAIEQDARLRIFAEKLIPQRPHAPEMSNTASESPATLTLLSPEEIKLLPPDEFVLLLEATQWNALSAEQRGAIEQDARLRILAEKVIPQRPHAPETS